MLRPKPTQKQCPCTLFCHSLILTEISHCSLCRRSSNITRTRHTEVTIIFIQNLRVDDRRSWRHGFRLASTPTGDISPSTWRGHRCRLLNGADESEHDGAAINGLQQRKGSRRTAKTDGRCRKPRAMDGWNESFSKRLKSQQAAADGCPQIRCGCRLLRMPVRTLWRQQLR